jgi:hypothetical protein
MPARRPANVGKEKGHEFRRNSPTPMRWTVFVLFALFLLVGAVFSWCRPAASLYELDANARSALFYVRSTRLRDAALALYYSGLASAELRRALIIVYIWDADLSLGGILLLASSGEVGRSTLFFISWA